MQKREYMRLKRNYRQCGERERDRQTDRQTETERHRGNKAHVNRMQQVSTEEVCGLAWLCRKGDTPRIAQATKIWPPSKMVYGQSRICPGK